MRNSMESPQKIKTRTSFDLGIPFLGIYLRESKALIWIDTCSPTFIAALFTIAKTWKQHKCSLMDKCVEKIWCAHTHTHFSPTEKEILPFMTTWMDLEDIMLSEIIQIKIHIKWFTYMWILKTDQFLRTDQLKQISPGCSLVGLMLKLKLQYVGHLMWRADSLEKTLVLGKIEGRRRRRQRMRWLDGITYSREF